MIDPIYYEKCYSIKPLPVACDISDCSLRNALAMLNFNLETEYVVVFSKYSLEFLPKITNGILNIKPVIQSDIDVDFWYVVCPSTKTIVYSPGA